MKTMLVYMIIISVSIFAFTSCKDESLDTTFIEDSASAEIEENNEFSKSRAEEMLEGVKNYQPGTAGASLKCCIASFGVLDYAENFGADKEFREFVKEYIISLSDDERLIFSENFEEINYFCEDLFEKGIKSVELLLNDAGNPNRYEEYTKEKYEAVKEAIAEAIN